MAGIVSTFILHALILMQLARMNGTSKFTDLPPDVTYDDSSGSSDRMWTNSQSEQIQEIIASLEPPEAGNVPQNSEQSTSTVNLDASGAGSVQQAGTSHEQFTFPVANLPNLEEFNEQSQESSNSEEDVKTDVASLQNQLKNYEAKHERRKEQNRRAAEKSRKRRKDEGEYLTKKTQKLRTSNNDLRSDIDELIKERDDLKIFIEQHKQICPLYFGRNQEVPSEPTPPPGGASNQGIEAAASGYQGATASHSAELVLRTQTVGLHSHNDTVSSSNTQLPLIFDPVDPEVIPPVLFAPSAPVLTLQQVNLSEDSDLQHVVPDVQLNNVYLPTISK